MAFEFEFDHMHLDQIAAISGASVESYLPESPNFRRIEVSGGTKNVVGEYTGTTETASEFRGFLSKNTEERSMRGGSDSAAGDLTIFYLFEDLDDAGTDFGVELEQSDIIEEIATGKRYEVDEVVDVNFGSSKPWGQAMVIGPKQ